MALARHVRVRLLQAARSACSYRGPSTAQGTQRHTEPTSLDGKGKLIMAEFTAAVVPERVPARRRHRCQRHRHRDLRGSRIRRSDRIRRCRRDRHRRHLRLDGPEPSWRPPKSLRRLPSTRSLDGTWFAVVAGTHQAYLAFPLVAPGTGHGPDGPAAPASRAHQAIAPVPRRRRHGDGDLADPRRPAVRLGARGWCSGTRSC